MNVSFEIGYQGDDVDSNDVEPRIYGDCDGRLHFDQRSEGTAQRERDLWYF